MHIGLGDCLHQFSWQCGMAHFERATSFLKRLDHSLNVFGQVAPSLGRHGIGNAVQGAADGLRHGVDGFFCALVLGANVIWRQVQGLTVTLCQSLSDVLGIGFLPCPKDGQGHRLR